MKNNEVKFLVGQERKKEPQVCCRMECDNKDSGSVRFDFRSRCESEAPYDTATLVS